MKWTYLQQTLFALLEKYPNVPIQPLREALIEGIDAFAYFREGTQYVGMCGKTRSAAIAELQEMEDHRVSSKANS